MKSDKPKMVICLSCKCQEKCIVRCFLRLIIMEIRANFPTCFIKSHWKLIENRTDLPRQLLGEFSLEVQGCLRKSPEEGVPEGWIFRSSLLRLSGLSRRITGGFSTQLTESLFKILWIPAFFRGAYLSNLASHKASRNPTHKNLWHHPLFEEIHP